MQPIVTGPITSSLFRNMVDNYVLSGTEMIESPQVVGKYTI